MKLGKVFIRCTFSIFILFFLCNVASAQTSPAIQDIVLEDKNLQSNKFENFLNRLKANFGLGFQKSHPVQGGIILNDCSCGSLFATISKVNAVDVSLNYGVFYYLGYGLLVGYESEDTFGKSSFRGDWLSVRYDRKISSGGRPVYFAPILRIGYYGQRYELEKVATNGLKFAKNDFDINSQFLYNKRGISLSPSFMFSIKGKSSIRFYFSTAYRLALKSKEGLYVRDDKFFAKTQFLEDDPKSSFLNVNGSTQHILNGFSFAIGIMYD